MEGPAPRVNDEVRLIVFALLVSYVFSQPLGQAFAAGLVEARDPLIRITPGSSWTHFGRRFRPLLIQAMLFWIFYFALAVATFLYCRWGEFWSVAGLMILGMGWVNLAALYLLPYAEIVRY